MENGDAIGLALTHTIANIYARVVVARPAHIFPKSHTDILEQFVAYRVPPERFLK